MDTLATVLESLSAIFTAFIGWLGEMYTFVISKPLLLVVLIGFFITGGVVGLFNRIMRG